MRIGNLFNKGLKVELSDIIHQNHALYMDGNYVPYVPRDITKDSQTSSFVLAKSFECLALNKKIIPQIKSIQDKLGYGKTVWSVRFEKNVFSMEIYFYYPDTIDYNSFNNIKELLNQNLETPICNQELPNGYKFGCISYNLDDTKTNVINLLGIEDGYEWKKGNCINTFSYSWKPTVNELTIVNQYFSFRNPNNFGEISAQLKTSFTKLFPSVKDPSLLDFYLFFPFLNEGDKFIFPMGIAEKNGAIGLYFYALSINQFIQFLEYFNYPIEFISVIRGVKEQIKHIKYDIGIDFYVMDNQIQVKKTTFAGTF